MNIGQNIGFTYKIGVFVTILLALCLITNISEADAQQTFWSKQEKIPEYYDTTQEPPYLIADQNHVVHAFNSQPLLLDDKNSPKAVFYRQWTIEGGWTYPNDILYDSMGGDVDILDVTSDQTGVVYLIYQKDFQDIYFTYANLANAVSSIAWSSSILIASQSTHVTLGFEGVAAIETDGVGNIVVIYSGSEYGSGLYSTYSLDYGDTWSRPNPVFLANDESLIVSNPKLYIGDMGLFHAVWNTIKSGGFGDLGYYANYDAQKKAWSEPLELDISGVDTPSVIEYQNNIFVSYYHRNVNGNWWRRSMDGGKTWNYPVQISSRHVGTNGAVSFVIDSNDVLHAFFGERIDGNNHGMWHSIWTGIKWTDPEAVVKGPQIRDEIGGNGFDPRSARAIVSNGNLLLVTWGTDGFGGMNGAWYSYKLIDAPELPPVPLPIPSVIPEIMLTEIFPAVIGTSEYENTPNIVLSTATASTQISQSPKILFSFSIIFIILLTALILRHNIFRFRDK